MEVSERGSENEKCVELFVDEIVTVSIVPSSIRTEKLLNFIRSTVRGNPYIGQLSLNM
jgi:hypothetical protein